ncbi:MAG: FAD:protein FMN transferase [Planctomycetaceae bacterium]
MTDDLHTLVVGRDAMACRFEVAFNAGEMPGDTEVAVEALDLVEAIEDRISIYRPGSELSRINATAAAGWVDVSADVWPLLMRARELWRLTGGGFDMAAGALVRCWGFLERQGRTPAAGDLAAARAASGMEHVEFDEPERRVRFSRPGLELNPGAIGKGWAIDRAAAMLAMRGVTSVLVHGGQSSVIARGVQGPATDGRRGWRVGIRHPVRPGRRLATITLTDRALGTSGSGTQFFVDRGRRLGHLLDPRTGQPATGVISATVIADSAADADALATAAYVLGTAGLQPVVAAGAGAILVFAAVDGGLRVVIANLAEHEVGIEPEPGVVIEWGVTEHGTP